MKEYTVRYSIGSYVYESVVKTSSSYAAILWANAIGGVNVSVVGEAVAWEEKEAAP
jgi:hypothetical protein